MHTSLFSYCGLGVGVSTDSVGLDETTVCAHNSTEFNIQFTKTTVYLTNRIVLPINCVYVTHGLKGTVKQQWLTSNTDQHRMKNGLVME